MAATRGNKLQSNLKKIEHPARSGIFIREFIEERKDKLYCSYRIEIPAKLTGTVRKIKQKKYLQDAKSLAEDYAKGAGVSGQSFFDLSDKDRLQATRAIQLTREHNVDLLEAVEFAIKRLRPNGGFKTVSEVVKEMQTSKRNRYEKGDLAYETFRSFRSRSDAFAEFFGDLRINELTKEQIHTWLNEIELEPRTVKNYLNVTAEVLRYSVQKHYCEDNPLDRLTDEERKELTGRYGEINEPEILSVSETRKLLNTALEEIDLGLLPIVAIGLFAGIRTYELIRLRWEHVNLFDESPYITIPNSMAKKRRVRNVPISDTLHQWLLICKGSPDEKLAPANYFLRFNKLYIKAGFYKTDDDGNKKSDWKRNAMRHSFGSYHYALYGDSIETSRIMGHKQGDDTLFTHYRALCTKKDAASYFNITPAVSSKKIIALNSRGSAAIDLNG